MENTGFLSDLSGSFSRMGDLDLRVDPARARSWFEQALQIRRKLVELEPENTGFLRDLSVSCLHLAECALRAGSAEQERDWSEHAVEAMRRAASLQPDDSGLQYNLACALARVGRAEESLAALERAAALGDCDPEWAEQDPDLSSLRDLPAFQSLLTRQRGEGRATPGTQP